MNFFLENLIQIFKKPFDVKRFSDSKYAIHKGIIYVPWPYTLDLTPDNFISRMIPVGNDVTRLVLLRDELYEATDVTFELNCDIRLCLMTEKDSICSEEIYDTSLCDKVTYWHHNHVAGSHFYRPETTTSNLK